MCQFIITGKLSRGVQGIVKSRRLTKTSPRRNILTPFYGVKIEGDDKVILHAGEEGHL